MNAHTQIDFIRVGLMVAFRTGSGASKVSGLEGAVNRSQADPERPLKSAKADVLTAGTVWLMASSDTRSLPAPEVKPFGFGRGFAYQLVSVPGGYMKCAVILFFVVVASLGSQTALGDSTMSLCRRASPSLECFYIKHQVGLNLAVLSKTGRRTYEKDLSVRVGVQSPSHVDIKGDVLFVHGFADRLDNHAPLYEEFNRIGLRVISFDLPGHGENMGSGNDINDWTFTDLAELAASVEQTVVRKTHVKPQALILAGWSTGGLLITRMAQGLEEKRLSRPISGLILYAPGIAIKKPWSIGEKNPDFMMGLVGRVTIKSLTHDPYPPHNGPIFPISPVVQFKFGMNLTFNAFLARTRPFPSHLPTLVFMGDEKEDVYADSASLKKWVSTQKEKGSTFYSIECKQGRHELDNEAFPIGAIVRTTSASFAKSVLDQSVSELAFKSIRCQF